MKIVKKVTGFLLSRWQGRANETRNKKQKNMNAKTIQSKINGIRRRDRYLKNGAIGNQEIH